MQRLPTLADELGDDGAGQLAAAYEMALLAMSLGTLSRVPDRETRLALVASMIAEGRRNGFHAGRMAEVGLSEVGERRDA